MNAVEAIEQLIWKKSQLKKLKFWLQDMEINEKPVDGIYWRRFKAGVWSQIEEMELEIGEIESRINEKLVGIDIKPFEKRG